MQIPDTEPDSVPWPKNGWDEVIPNLFQGSQVRLPIKFSDYESQKVTVRKEFDAVFSFFHSPEPWDGPAPGVHHTHYPIPDGTLLEEELRMVRVYARIIARKVKIQNKVLVRCQAGYNRSGLVVAFALMELGYTAEEAVALIRKARGEHALFRIAFLEYLKAAQEEKDAQPA